MSTQQSDYSGAIASDLKLTHIVAIIAAVTVVILCVFILTVKSLSYPLTPEVAETLIAGVSFMVITYLACDAALGGAYANAAATMTGVTVVAGPTAPAQPATQTSAQVVSGLPTASDIQQLTASLDAYQTLLNKLKAPAAPTAPTTT